MVERGKWVALALLVSVTSGCPVPGDEAGEDEIGNGSTDGSTGDSSTSDADQGTGGVAEGADDIEPPDDATPDMDESGASETAGEDETDETDETDDGGEGGSECWDLTSADGVVPFVIVGDTTELTDDHMAGCSEDSGGRDFSFGFTAPFAGEFVFDTKGTSFDTVLSVDRGECRADELACNDDFIGLTSRVVLPLDEGELVTVIVDGFDEGEAGPFSLSIDHYVSPVCSAMMIAPVLPKIMLGDTSESTDQHTGGCGGAASPDDMYRFTAPGTGLYRFHTFGSSFDTVLYVWDDCEGPELGCSDDANLELQSEVVVELDGGEQVWIVVDGVDESAMGPYQLNVEKL